MTGPPLLSRVRLKRNTSIATLTSLLLDNHRGGGSMQAGHHLIWSLFANDRDQARDFLWRETTKGAFMVLSARRPEDSHSLFEIDTKPFDPVLAPGDRLRFSLRANPVVRKRRSPNDRYAVKHDIVMNALSLHPKGGRAESRQAEICSHGFAWLERQAAMHGFSVEKDHVEIDGYMRHCMARKNGNQPMTFSTLEYEGVLKVTDSAAFLSQISKGFGSAKAYGCGLMLIRKI